MMTWSVISPRNHFDGSVPSKKVNTEQKASPSQVFDFLEMDLKLDSVSSVGSEVSAVKHSPTSQASSGVHNMGVLPSVHSQPVHSSNEMLEFRAAQQMPELLVTYIRQRCAMFEHCSEVDFDRAAMDTLFKIPFLQALQTVEHFSISVSPRIIKRSAYLMGILRGQEAHWEKDELGRSSYHLLRMPAQLQVFIGRCCLGGNTLPSDFTPEVVAHLQSLPPRFAVESIQAFNGNKRIVAGARGGVINRSRFFLRLVQNLAQQNLSPPVPTQRPQLTPMSRMESLSSLGSAGSVTHSIFDPEERYMSPQRDFVPRNAYENQLRLELENTQRQLQMLQQDYACLRSSATPRPRHM